MARTNKQKDKSEFKDINSENAKQAFNYYLQENPYFAESIAREYGLVEGLINSYESKGEYLRAGLNAEKYGMIKKAIGFYKKTEGAEDLIENLNYLLSVVSENVEEINNKTLRTIIEKNDLIKIVNKIELKN